jgi:hypothetical protein
VTDREKDVIDLANESPYRDTVYGSQKQMAEALGVSRWTVSRRMGGKTLSDTNTEKIVQRAESQFARITEKWAEIDADKTMSGAEKHMAWARWMRLEMDLLGTAAPSRSIQAHVSSGETSPLFLKFKKATAGLSDSQLEEVFKQLASIPREVVVTVKDASWFPEPMTKQLESGE